MNEQNGTVIMDSSAESVGLRIKKARKLLNLRQEDLAKDLNMGMSTLSNYEKGKKYPVCEFFIAMATQYNISVEYLVLGIGEPFINLEKGWDDFFKDKPFGDFTDDVKKMLFYMKRSNWALSFINAHFKGFFIKNREDIEKEIQENEGQKEER
jgi:transcriptional regulator with XRE-family HTH domain